MGRRLKEPVGHLPHSPSPLSVLCPPTRTQVPSDSPPPACLQVYLSHPPRAADTREFLGKPLSSQHQIPFRGSPSVHPLAPTFAQPTSRRAASHCHVGPLLPLGGHLLIQASHFLALFLDNPIYTQPPMHTLIQSTRCPHQPRANSNPGSLVCGAACPQCPRKAVPSRHWESC